MPAITVEKIVYPGKSLGHIDGIVCLTDEGLPGERVEIVPGKIRAHLIEARTERLIAPSPRRTQPRCAHYRACSSYQIMDDAFQLEIKSVQLEEILAAAAAEPAPIRMIASPLTWNYRTRARFHVLWTPQGGRPAYNVPGIRDEFVPVDVCHLPAAPLFDLVTAALQAFPRPAPALREIEARVGADRSAPLLIFHWSAPPGPRDLDPVLMGLSPAWRPAGIVNVFKRRGRDEEILVWGRDFIEERVGEARFRIGARSFFQVNPAVLPAVIDVMAGALRSHGARRLADIYSGLGLLGLTLAPEVEAVYAVDDEPENIRRLKENIALNRTAGVTVCEGRAEDWMDWVLDRNIDAIVFDPPRKGLDPGLIARLLRRPVPLILYLSCNPTTLARDLKSLEPSYRPIRLTGFDFFPQTPHIETLAILERR
jgi:23S rRNA (uracil1939-C5)-methyltransferase